MVHEKPVGESHVRLEAGNAALLECVSKRADSTRSWDSDASEQFVGEIPHLGFAKLDSGTRLKEVPVGCVDIEIRAKAILLDEEGLSVVEPSVELDDGDARSNSVSRLNESPGMHESPLRIGA